jgi:predicted RNase H-like nuclease (RuvC/YqgF family)
MYAEDIEEERKRQMRAEEQTTRSARNIYQLGQQVKELQQEINNLAGENVQPAKKV